MDRIQTGGAGNLNIPEEKIYELGNWQSCGVTRDTPDLSFDLESFDVSVELEALLTFTDPSTVNDGDEIDLNNQVPLELISPLKIGNNLFGVERGIAVPFLTLESSTYRFGVRQNSSQQHTLRGDSYFYLDGAPYYEEYSGNGVSATFALSNTAIEYNYSGDTIHVVEVSVVYSDGTYRRLVFGDDYTDTTTDFTLADPANDAPTGSVIRVIYASATATSYPQTVHEDSSVKPCAIRGKDIDVYIGTDAATPVFSRWNSVTSFEVTRRVTLDADEEFGNPQLVSQDFDVPDVSGTITVKPRDLDDLYGKIYEVANVPAGEIAGPFTSVALPVEVRITDPADGTRQKTLYIPDARFTIPSLQGRVQQKLEVQFGFSSEGGQLLVYKGER